MINRQIYFDSYTNALDYCFNNVSAYEINKNDTFHNQKLHIQIFRLSLETFELNFYVAP